MLAQSGSLSIGADTLLLQSEPGICLLLTTKEDSLRNFLKGRRDEVMPNTLNTSSEQLWKLELFPLRRLVWHTKEQRQREKQRTMNI